MPDEMAVLNLIDLQGLEQEQVASVLGISRKTVWRDIHEVRRKIADALINGKTIEVSGCKRRLEGRCPQWNRRMCPKEDGGICPRLVRPASADGNENTEQPPG
jgi:transposase